MADLILKDEGLPCCSGTYNSMHAAFLLPLFNAHSLLQVMSETVASALQFMDEDRTKETRQFIRMIDLFFDALNVKNPLEGKLKRKPFRFPYYTPQDERFKVYLSVLVGITHAFTRVISLYFQWLKNNFLGYLDGWEKEVSGRQGFTKAQQKRMCLSKETLEGLRITGKLHSYIVSFERPLSHMCYILQ